MARQKRYRGPCVPTRISLAWVRRLLLPLIVLGVPADAAPVLTVIDVQPFIFHALVTVSQDQAGTVYCGALAYSLTYTPSSYQLKTGSGLAGHGSTAVQAYVAAQVVVSGLVPASIYTLYCYGEDALLSGIDINGILATKQSFVATASGGDYEAPTFQYITPFQFIENVAITVYTQLSEEGRVWCVARVEAVYGSSVPSVSDVMDNQNVDSWATATATAANLFQVTLRLQGLQEDTIYSIYCFAEDASGNGMDGSPALVPDPNAVSNTRRSGLRTLSTVNTSSFVLVSPSGESSYRVNPATWNLQLPRSVISGCQVRTDLESWKAPLELLSAALSLPQAGLAAFGCAQLLAAPRGGGPFLAVLWRGRCTFAEKAYRAHRAGYHGLLILNHAAQADILPDMTAHGRDADVEIPGWLMQHSDGQTLISAAAAEPLLRASIADLRRKPRLGDAQSDEYGRRVYILQ